MPELKNYRMINSRLVESFARQLGLPVDQEKTVQGNFGIGAKIGSAGFNTSRKQSPMPAEDPRLLPPIVESLRESGQLRVFRPDGTRDFEDADPSDWYVYEDGVIATPVSVPVRVALGGSEYLPEHLTVWTLDPAAPTREPNDQWDWLGAYVFIVQELQPEVEVPRFGVSSLSALRLLVQKLAVQGDINWRDLNRVRDNDVYDDWRNGHPIQRLRQVGAVAGRSRKIETVYKVAYMSDEQSIEVGGVRKRINDILAYPLYIAE